METRSLGVGLSEGAEREAGVAAETQTTRLGSSRCGVGAKIPAGQVCSELSFQSWAHPCLLSLQLFCFWISLTLVKFRLR